MKHEFKDKCDKCGKYERCKGYSNVGKIYCDKCAKELGLLKVNIIADTKNDIKDDTKNNAKTKRKRVKK